MTNVFTPHIVASLMLLARVAAADPGVHDNDPETPSVASPVPRVEAKEAGGLGYVFPLQLGVGRGVSIADHAFTGSVYWCVAVVALLRTEGVWGVVVGGALDRGVREADVVIATSPQFLCAVGGFVLSRILRVPYVLEIRDLWPQSIVEVGALPARHPVVLVLEQLERFL